MRISIFRHTKYQHKRHNPSYPLRIESLRRQARTEVHRPKGSLTSESSAYMHISLSPRNWLINHRNTVSVQAIIQKVLGQKTLPPFLLVLFFITVTVSLTASERLLQNDYRKFRKRPDDLIVNPENPSTISLSDDDAEAFILFCIATHH